MSVSKQSIKDLSWTELISLRSYYASLKSECHDMHGIRLMNKAKEFNEYSGELERLDKYIQAKYQRIKENTTK